eukprot:TRINITY_DN64716_c0_g1_i1.p1 TRINITY_DN64716_c0_g1~~TRINITY_DN64716_c0_g1_i1.p1  ORF type:complete len:532 (-),score=97.34 TRINITY_DN64716_c0_g1_i1:450-2045(-)
MPSSMTTALLSGQAVKAKSAEIAAPEGKKHWDEWVQSLDEAEATLRQTFRSGKTKTYEWRLSQLKALERMFLDEVDAMTTALREDLNRPECESIVGDVGSTVAEIRFAMDNLKAWMKPEKVSTTLLMQPGSSRINPTPKGVAFIMGAWNFPINLTLAPAIGAIAAGNCVVLKPSDLSPACAKLIKELCDRYLDPTAIRTFLGEIDHSTELLKRKWDHIFYTGGGAVGKVVMTAAAKHLCPVTLELGGKCPCIVDRGLSSSQLKTAANRIVSSALFFNAGQICVSPDYILVHKDAEKQVLDALQQAVERMFPNGSSIDTLGKIVNERHWDRVKRLIETSGGEVKCGGVGTGSGADRSARFIPPTIISRPKLDSPAMTEEKFGPLVSVLPVDDLAAAIDFVNSRETPLALYIFSSSSRNAETVLSATNSGGALINDTFIHLGNPHLPFGGCGSSGMGQYHGKHGFMEFSHKRAVLSKTLFPDVDRYPPYDNFKLGLLRRVQLGPLVPTPVKVAAAVLVVAAIGAVVMSRLSYT